VEVTATGTMASGLNWTKVGLKAYDPETEEIEILRFELD